MSEVIKVKVKLRHLSYQPPVEGPPIPITIDMVKKAISQMKAGKAPGLPGIVVEMIRAAGDMGASMIRGLTNALQSFAMARYPLTGSRFSLSASTREMGTHWKGGTTAVSSWQSRSWKSWRGLWMASSDRWCQSMIPSLASSQAEAQQMQSLLWGSCKRSIKLPTRDSTWLYRCMHDIERMCHEQRKITLACLVFELSALDLVPYSKLCPGYNS